MSKPNFREMKVLHDLCLGNIEPSSYFLGAGPKTLEALLSKGWIVRAHDEIYDVDGYKITAAGSEAFDRASDPSRRKPGTPIKLRPYRKPS